MYFQRRSWRVVALLLSSPAPPAQRRVRVVIVSHKRQQPGFGWLFLGQQRGIIRSSAEFIKLIHHEGCRLLRRLDRHRLGLRASVRPQVRVSRAKRGSSRIFWICQRGEASQVCGGERKDSSWCPSMGDYNVERQEACENSGRCHREQRNKSPASSLAPQSRWKYTVTSYYTSFSVGENTCHPFDRSGQAHHRMDQQTRWMGCEVWTAGSSRGAALDWVFVSRRAPRGQVN